LRGSRGREPGSPVPGQARRAPIHPDPRAMGFRVSARQHERELAMREALFMRVTWLVTVLIAGTSLGVPASATTANDPLPSWKDTGPKKAIVAFVHRVTKTGTSDFVPRSERIATFDNDGTLQCEQPMYVQVQFVADHVKALAPQHPDWA